MNKIYKVLALATNDSRNAGHAISVAKKTDTSKFDVRVVTLVSKYSDSTYALYPSRWMYYLHTYFFRYLFNFLRTGYFRLSKANDPHCFVNVDLSLATAEKILKKYGDIPDVIKLHWVDGFVTPKILYNLHRLTGAEIVWVFTDEYPLGAGCHYPCECRGFINGCVNCPIAFNKNAVKKMFNRKCYYLKELPVTIVGPTNAVIKAKDSVILKDKTIIKSISRPSFPLQDRNYCRNLFAFSDNDFVILFGAANVNDKRKGIKYTIDALNKVKSEQNIDNITLLVVGQDNTDLLTQLSGFKVKSLGFLKQNDLFQAFRASDLFISTTIADTGPQMVLFSVFYGVPVVSFNVGYAFDFVKHKANGYISDYCDSNSVADGIEYFLSMPMSERNKVESYNNELLIKISEYPQAMDILYEHLCNKPQ